MHFRILFDGLTRCLLILGLSWSVAAFGQQEPKESPEIVSPLGTKCYALKDEKGAVAAAAEQVRQHPSNVDKITALGSAQADIWRFRDAIATYTRGIKLAPRNALLYYHRGHRYISTRQFKKASQDLEKASKLNTKDFDIWYHLGLSYYLRGDFARAARAYESCLSVVNEQMNNGQVKTDGWLVATSDWLYMTYRRTGQEAKTAQILERIKPGMNPKDSEEYYERLLMYKGLKSENDLLNLEKNSTALQIATLGYGIGNWNLYNGRRDRAREIFRKVVSGTYWPAFGFIAAEVELKRKP